MRENSLEAIPPDRQRILNDIQELGEDPFGGLVKPLNGKKHKGLFRKAVSALSSNPSMRCISKKSSPFCLGMKGHIGKRGCFGFAFNGESASVGLNPMPLTWILWTTIEYAYLCR